MIKVTTYLRFCSLVQRELFLILSMADVICLSIYVGCKINDEEEENQHNYIHINQGQNEGVGGGVLVSVE
jgi:hypothetical protein